ncbi:MAG: hypothetical protein F4077_09365 [Gammaproteobacteria bacterium]|nr:hypothetical protein [Gammaproteobacteria bacterium]MYI77943.1 hypothetical protein [Gammaproteobacteria bacterium]
MLRATMTCFQFCIFRGSVRTVKGDNATIVTFFLLLILLELYPLVALFPHSEIASQLLQHRTAIWLLALVWHGLAIVMIFALLKMKHSMSQFRGTLASYFGVFLLFQLVGLLLQLLSQGTLPSGIRTLVLIVWLSWSCCVVGYVFGSALSIKFYQGVVLAFLINVVSYVLAFVVIGSILSNELREIFLQQVRS